MGAGWGVAESQNGGWEGGGVSHASHFCDTPSKCPLWSGGGSLPPTESGRPKNQRL